MNHRASQLRIIWLGPRDGALGWLRQRIADYSSPSIHSVVLQDGLADRHSLRESCESGFDRLIYACVNRIEYPHEDLQWLSQAYPELPVALAVDSYWDGWRRTGLAVVPCAVLPWHRWWDGWVDWFEASNAEWFGPNIAPVKFDCGGALKCIPTTGAVVAGCQEIAQAWKLAARVVGAETNFRNVEQVARLGTQSRLDWLLWDDSCLTTSFGCGDINETEDWLRQAKNRLPQTQFYFAFTNPGWHQWESLLAVGADEVLSKPNTGRGLQRLLASSSGQIGLNRQSIGTR